MPTRRQMLVAAATLPLAGCGFELRRAPELKFHTLLLTGFRPRSTLEKELRTYINGSKTTVVVDAVAQAQVVLESLEDSHDRVVVASSAAGQVTEFNLRARFRFKVRSVSGRELIPEATLEQNRDLSYTESAALAKETEESYLYLAMQTDIVSQVLRRLASIQTF
jgi:LPS-assembly lipoprotein